MGGLVMLETVKGVVNGTLKSKPQDDTRASLAPILKKEDGFIDWTRPAAQIHNRVRAFNPWPGTVTKFRGQTCKILKTAVPGLDLPSTATSAGSILVSKGSVKVVCGGGTLLEILSIQPENRKAVAGADFANGARIQADEKFQPVMDN
jgi:methionyl-tRNA formyltransferase